MVVLFGGVLGWVGIENQVWFGMIVGVATSLLERLSWSCMRTLLSGGFSGVFTGEAAGQERIWYFEVPLW